MHHAWSLSVARSWTSKMQPPHIAGTYCATTLCTANAQNATFRASSSAQRKTGVPQRRPLTLCGVMHRSGCTCSPQVYGLRPVYSHSTEYKHGTCSAVE
jgi:hypothetical protein